MGGLAFHTERRQPVGKSMYAKVWREARQLALDPVQATGPLARVPYDLRHAALSLWLNSGVDPTDVAERAGDSVEVLFRWYAKCLDGRRERNNRLTAEHSAPTRITQPAKFADLPLAFRWNGS